MIIKPGHDYARYSADRESVEFHDNKAPGMRDGIKILMQDRFDSQISLVISDAEVLELRDFLDAWLEEDD